MGFKPNPSPTESIHLKIAQTPSSPLVMLEASAQNQPRFFKKALKNLFSKNDFKETWADAFSLTSWGLWDSSNFQNDLFCGSWTGFKARPTLKILPTGKKIRKNS